MQIPNFNPPSNSTPQLNTNDKKPVLTPFMKCCEQLDHEAVLKLAPQNLKAIAEGKQLYLGDNGEIQAEGATWTRSWLGAKAYRDLSGLPYFFEKLNTALDSIPPKQYDQFIDLHSQLSEAQNGLENLKKHYEKTSPHYLSSDYTENKANITAALTKIAEMQTKFTENLSLPKNKLDEKQLEKIETLIKESQITPKVRDSILSNIQEITHFNKKFNEYKETKESVENKLAECQIKKEKIINETANKMQGSLSEVTHEEVVSMLKVESFGFPDLENIKSEEQLLKQELNALEAHWKEAQNVKKLSMSQPQRQDELSNESDFSDFEHIEKPTKSMPLSTNFAVDQIGVKSAFSNIHRNKNQNNLGTIYESLLGISKCEKGQKLHFSEHGIIKAEPDAFLNRKLAGYQDVSRDIKNLAVFANSLDEQFSRALPYNESNEMMQAIEGAKKGLKVLLDAYSSKEDNYSIVAQALVILSVQYDRLSAIKVTFDKMSPQEVIEHVTKSLEEKSNLLDVMYTLNVLGLFKKSNIDQSEQSSPLPQFFSVLKSSALQENEKTALFAEALLRMQTINQDIEQREEELGGKQAELEKYGASREKMDTAKAELVKKEIEGLKNELATQVKEQERLGVALGLLMDRIGAINGGTVNLSRETPRERILKACQTDLKEACAYITQEEDNAKAVKVQGQEPSYWNSFKDNHKEILNAVLLAAITQNPAPLAKPLIQVAARKVEEQISVKINPEVTAAAHDLAQKKFSEKK